MRIVIASVHENFLNHRTHFIHMLITNLTYIKPYLNLYMPIIVAIFAIPACSIHYEPDFCQTHTEPLNRNRSACFDVYGYVLGNIEPGANVFLYYVNNFNYDSVMQTVRKCSPVQIVRVNKTAEYNFACLDYGQYVAAILSSSYRNSSVGSPLPYEFKNENVSVEIVFQGGDYEYSVGAISINKTHQAQP